MNWIYENLIFIIKNHPLKTEDATSYILDSSQTPHQENGKGLLFNMFNLLLLRWTSRINHLMQMAKPCFLYIYGSIWPQVHQVNLLLEFDSIQFIFHMKDRWQFLHHAYYIFLKRPDIFWKFIESRCMFSKNTTNVASKRSTPP